MFRLPLFKLSDNVWAQICLERAHSLTLASASLNPSCPVHYSFLVAFLDPPVGYQQHLLLVVTSQDVSQHCQIALVENHGSNYACQCRRHKRDRSIPGSRRSLEGGHGNSLQFSCLENPMDSLYCCKESEMTEATEHACNSRLLVLGVVRMSL